MSEAVSIRVAVVAPTFNNARTLPALLSDLASIVPDVPVIVVDDGCSDETPVLLASWSAAGGKRHVVTHPTNLGKARAMQNGFARARELGFTHALTIDTDGQHDARDVPAMLALAARRPADLVVGSRSTEVAGYPTGSRVGRWASNTLICWESGALTEDSQCGLRVYPLSELSRVPSYADRFGYETEIITRFAWAGGQIAQAPIRCVYEVAGGRTTHFRPWVDSFKATAMHLRLLARSFMPWPVRKTMPNAGNYGTIAERVARWFNPVRAWKQVKNDPEARRSLAPGLACGLFIGSLPLYGLKTIASVLLAKLMRTTPFVVIAGSSVINTPPMGAFVAGIAIVIGHVVLRGRVPTLSDYNLSHFRETFTKVGVDWVVGGSILGLVLAIVGYVSVRLIIWWTSREQSGPLVQAVSAE